MKHIRSIASVAILLLAMASSYAHTTVTSTIPGNGSVLAESPPVIEIRFKDHARLTSVVVSHAGRADRQLDFTPKESATSFSIPSPALEAGQNTIGWKALSMDGHVVSGSFSLTIKTPAAAAK